MKHTTYFQTFGFCEYPNIIDVIKSLKLLTIIREHAKLIKKSVKD